MAAKSLNNPIYAIAGPTASGKTALGVRLAKNYGGEVVNFDSVQIYQRIQIATAKPSEEEKQGVPHHLIDYVDPNISYTAADWSEDATKKINEIEARGNIPILVGGTGFYLRTLRNPLFESPKTDIELRERLQKIGQVRGAVYLHRVLERIDPVAAQAIFPNDSVRVVRAIEVYLQTKTRISEFQPKREAPPEFADRIRVFVLSPPRDVLYQRINARAELHFASGLVNEVGTLISNGIRTDGNALGAHGYRRVCEYLRGERTLESAVEMTQQDVRNYAKRQLTWFRREHGAIWLDGFGDSDEVWRSLLSHL